jgi:hypothetical protein
MDLVKQLKNLMQLILLQEVNSLAPSRLKNSGTGARTFALPNLS